MTIPTDGRIDLDALAEEAFNANGRELGGPFWHELPAVERERILRTIQAIDLARRAEAKADDRPDPTPNSAFDAWVASLPKESWAKYDLSACRLGWDAARRAAIPSEQGEAVATGEDWRTWCEEWHAAVESAALMLGLRVGLGASEFVEAVRSYAHPAPAAGVKAPFDVFGQEAIDAAMENERAAQQFRDDLVASPSPPALDGAGRDAVIEECAKVADGAAAQWRQNSDTLPEGLGGWGPMCAEEIADAIRSLKETP